MVWRLGSALVVGSLVLFGLGVAPAAAEPPVNDGVEGAVVVTAWPYATTFDVSGATADGDDQAVDTLCVLPPATHSVWFSFTPGGDTSMLGFAKAGNLGEWPMSISVMTGASGSLQPVSCSLPSDSSWIALTAGTRYLIRVSLSDAELPAGTTGWLFLYRATCNNRTGYSDLNGDGCPDMAVGMPGASVGSARGAGAVEVAYGAFPNVFERRRQRLEPGGALGVPVEPGSGFGTTVVQGRLDEDEFNDLAIGIPRLDARGAVDAGAVLVLFGGPDGVGQRRLLLRQGTLPGSGRAESGDRFGTTLALSRNGVLAVGAPGEDIGAARDAGAVVTYRGFSTSGVAPRARLLSQAGPAVVGAAEAGDRFGSAIAFRRDGTLLVGVPGEDIGAIADAGAVIVVLPSGATKGFSQNSPGMGGVAEAGDHFGAAVSETSEYGGMIAIGVPGEDVGSIRDAGMINWLDEGTTGAMPHPITAVLTQNSTRDPGKAERGDHFGSVLAPGRGLSGLLIGVPDEDVGTLVDAGVVYAYGRILTQSSDAYGGPEPGDRFGASLTTSPINPADDEDVDYAVYAGAPGEDLVGMADVGLVQQVASGITIVPSARRAGQRYGAVIQSS